MKEKTVQNRVRVLRLLHSRGTDLLNLKSVFTAINHVKIRRHKKTTNRHRVERRLKEQCRPSLPEVLRSVWHTNLSEQILSQRDAISSEDSMDPLEREIDQLIAGSLKKVACFLQILKETYCRCGEGWKIKWIDVNATHNIVTLNNPEKKGTPRQSRCHAN